MSKYELTWVNESKGEFPSVFSCYYNDEFVMRIAAQMRIKPGAHLVKKHKDIESINRYREWSVRGYAFTLPDIPFAGWDTEEAAKQDIQKSFDVFCEKASRLNLAYIPKYPLIWKQVDEQKWKGNFKMLVYPSLTEGSVAFSFDEKRKSPSYKKCVAFNIFIGEELYDPIYIRASTLGEVKKKAQIIFDKIIDGESDDKEFGGLAIDVSELLGEPNG